VREWSETDIQVTQVLTDMAASYVVNATDLAQSLLVTGQLREALETRVIIEQAKGVLAAELGCSVDEAFGVLRDHSRSHNASLRSVAHGVVHLGLRPTRRSR
jgi:AmiR/NasT family two-component response regulator